MVPVSLRLSHSRPHVVFVFFSFSLLTLLSTWAELIMGSCLWPTHLACLPPAAAHWPSFLPLLKVVALSFSLLDCWATWIPWTCPRTTLKYLSVWVAWSVGKHEREQQKKSECASKKRSVRVCGFPPYPWSPEPPSPHLYILHRGVCSLPFLPLVVRARCRTLCPAPIYSALWFCK